ncbi:class I SAM-dependent methyltransferase [Acidaminobacter sp. JC074]|uniref:class I SAM-dependent methyltransferase n=1 Tax=Acidaminobacter sp. JC074 TaxID=2530199 RepID=UPI001F0D28AA|nr:class I SAM-dependent methyltransferase [Acidaminobacter sp. JC074]MCH4886279.1 class I SAM-dependent methyltransferase [Acidaminobacter sp. JC074]
MSQTWSTKIQGIDTLNLNREVRFTEKTFKHILDVINLNETDKVLELGCGPGTFSRRLASFYPNMKIVGLDFDNKFIEYCKSQADKESYDKLVYCQGDALDTGFNDACFDVCTSHTVIEHLPNQEFLSEQYRLLKPGGGVIVFNTRADVAIRSEEGINPVEREIELLDKVSVTLKVLNEENQVALYSANPQQILRTMENVGFTDLQIDAVPYTICLDDYRNSQKYKVQILESEKKSLMEFIHMSLIENPDTITNKEFKELEILISERFARRVKMIESEENLWDFNITPTLVLMGRKPLT